MRNHHHHHLLTLLMIIPTLSYLSSAFRHTISLRSSRRNTILLLQNAQRRHTLRITAHPPNRPSSSHRNQSLSTTTGAEGPEIRTLVDRLQPAVGMRLVDIRLLSGKYTCGNNIRRCRPIGFDAFRKTVTRYHHRDDDIPDSGDDDVGLDQLVVDIITQINSKGNFLWILLDDGVESLTRIHVGRGIDASHGSDYQRSVWITLSETGRCWNDVHPRKNEARWYLEVMNVSSRQSRKVYFDDPNDAGEIRFSLSASELQRQLDGLGPDILKEEEFGEDVFLGIVARESLERNVCRFLMDSKNLSGIGNYLLSESLYRANIDPFASLDELDNHQRRTLFREIRDTARESYQAQSNTTTTSNRKFELQCYGQTVCTRGHPVVRDANGPHGDTVYYAEEQLFVPRSMRDESGRLKPANAATVATESALSSRSFNTATTNLAKHLTDASWNHALANILSSESFRRLADFLTAERTQGSTIYPPEDQIFAALNLCPLENVKVVIVGQDPYHGPNQAHGLAFSVRRGTKIPPSLHNIFREAVNDVGIDHPREGNLDHWARQGVLLLNTILTVRKNEANSHARKGWEEFTDAIIRILNDQTNGLVFLLWGAPAAKKAKGVDDAKHCVIRCSHPSPLGATKTSLPFLGSKCFSRANDALREGGKEPIDWSVR